MLPVRSLRVPSRLQKSENNRRVNPERPWRITAGGWFFFFFRGKGRVDLKAKMILRLCKVALVAAVAFFVTLVVFNNLTDYFSNYHFVQHVLGMDTTFPGNSGMWRAIRSAEADTIFYWTIILWETVIALLCWWGAVNLLLALKAGSAIFNRAKNMAIAGLTASLLLWFVAFISVGGEWFLMWQSTIWNGQDAAFRMFTCTGIVLILLIIPDRENLKAD
jgi:predicted small integral membrane protein